jgi:hypothetical protein
MTTEEAAAGDKPAIEVMEDADESEVSPPKPRFTGHRCTVASRHTTTLPFSQPCPNIQRSNQATNQGFFQPVNISSFSSSLLSFVTLCEVESTHR